MYNSDLRSLARSALKGRWVRMSLLMLLATLLGGVVGLQLKPFSVILNGLLETWENYRIMVLLEELDSEFAQLYMQDIRISVLAMAGRLLCSLLLGGFVSLGLVRIGLKTLDGAPVNASMLFPKGFYWKALRLNLVRSLIIIMWSLLLIWPGVAASCSYAMADYLLLQNPDMGVMEILRESKKRMQGRRWSLFRLDLSFIGWYLLAALPGNVLMEYGAARYADFAGKALVLLLNCIVTAYRAPAFAAFCRQVDSGEEILVEIP